MGKGGQGKGCPTINTAERALLDGYRMGVAQGNKRTPQTDWGGGKGGSKGGGKNGGGGKAAGNAAAGAAKEDRTCQRQGCRAAVQKQATWGGGIQCHCCGLSLTATVPVQQLVGWAWDKRLKTEADNAQVKAGGAAAQPKPAVAAAGSAPKAAPSTEDLLALRTERLALLKTAATTGKVEPPPPPTALQEVAKVFQEEKTQMEKVKLDKDLIDQTATFEQVGAVLESLQEELLPSKRSGLSPKEVLDSLLSKSSELKSDRGKAQAQEALCTTQACLTTMRAAGTSEADEIMVLMLVREKKQLSELSKLTDKAPSHDMRKETLSSIRQNFVKQLQAQTDHRSTGAAKAEERATARHKQASAILAAAQALMQATADTKTLLCREHSQRAAAKKEQGVQVLALINAKIEELDQQEMIGMVDGDEEENTATEDDRDAAVRLTTLLQAQLHQLQQEAQRTVAGMAGQGAAPPTPGAAPAQPAAQGAAAPATPAAAVVAVQHRFLDCTAAVEREQLPRPLPDTGTVTEETKEIVTAVHEFYSARPFTVIPPTSAQDLGADVETLYAMIGEQVWKAFFGDMMPDAQEALPSQLHAVIAYQTRKAASSIKGLGKGKKGKQADGQVQY